MKSEYKHIVLVEPSTINYFVKALREKTLVFWIGKPSKTAYADTLCNLSFIEEAELKNGILLAVKFVAVDVQLLEPEQKTRYLTCFEGFGAGVIDTKGLSKKDFLKMYDAKIEEKIVSLIRSNAASAPGVSNPSNRVTKR